MKMQRNVFKYTQIKCIHLGCKFYEILFHRIKKNHIIENFRVYRYLKIINISRHGLMPVECNHKTGVSILFHQKQYSYN